MTVPPPHGHSPSALRRPGAPSRGAACSTEKLLRWRAGGRGSWEGTLTGPRGAPSCGLRPGAQRAPGSGAGAAPPGTRRAAGTPVLPDPREEATAAPRSHSTATWALGGPGLLGPLPPAPCPAPPATSDLSFQIFPRLGSRAVDGPATPVKPWPSQRLWFLDASWGRVGSHEGERCPAHGRRPENICGGRGGAGF